MVESPADRGLAAVSVGGPYRCVTPDFFQGGNTTSQALLGKHGDFDLGHVQPTGMFGGGVPNDPRKELRRPLWSEGLDQRHGIVGVEVVQNKMNATGSWITVQKITHEACKVGSGAVLASLHEPPPGEGLHSHKDAAGPATAVFVVLPDNPPASDRLRRTRVVQHLVRLFVHANHGFRRTMRLFVLVQHVFHPLPKLLVQLRHAPRFFRHGFTSCAFSHKLTSLLLIDFTKPRLAACSQRSSSVQRTRPSGGSVQANATTCCFCRPVKSDGRPDRGESYNVPSNPSSQNRLRTLRTVRSAHPTCSTICWSIRPASDFSRINARRTTRTGRVPDCATSCNCCRAPSVRRTICSFMPGLIPPARISWKRY